MRRRLSAAVLAAVATVIATPASAQTGTQTVASATACAPLRDLRIPDVKITQAAAAPASTDQRPGVRVANCRVAGTIGRDVDFVVVLPDTWNERLLMTGNGGYAGSFASLVGANDGYLAVTTNTGHQGSGTSAKWAHKDMQRQMEFGYLAVHQTADVAKAIARAYYGVSPKFSYFNGCSNGGRQGLMEAQRYPEDFDAIIAGAPAYNFTTIATSFVRNLQAAFPAPAGLDKPAITRDNLRLLSSQALAACDARDGVTDGLIDDPRKCTFKVSSIKACPNDQPAPDCLTAAARAAIEKIQSPVEIGGNKVYPGQPFGDEAENAGWPAWITGDGNRKAVDSLYPTAQAAFSIEGYKYIVTGDTGWSYLRYNLGTWATDSWLASNFLDATNADLSKFAARGGKLIMYHGWSDPALNALSTIDYYDQVLERDAKTPSYLRLFLMPGVLHCAGGPGPSQVPWQDALRSWREDDKAPDRLIATKNNQQGRAVRTRPLCPYPQHAVYSGSGSTDEASNFVCREDK